MTAPASITLGDAESVLARRAADLLASGPADASTLISHVCQLPGAPAMIAEHMATALFAGHARFARGADGRWCLRELAAPAWTYGAAAALATDADLSHQAFSVVDVETTGTNLRGGDRVTEVAVVRVQDGVATPVFDTLVNPDRPIPPAIVAVTHITWEMVKHAPRFAEICDQLLGVLEGTVFVAHNAGFDWRFLSTEIHRATRRPLYGRRLCTVRMARRLLPQLRRRNLDALSAYYGVTNGARHRAGGDAVATAAILLRLLAAARDRGCVTLSDLQHLVDARTNATNASTSASTSASTNASTNASTSARKRPRRRPALPHSASDDSAA